MSMFDWVVLSVVIVALIWWLQRHLRRSFRTDCSRGRCSTCNGCGKGQGVPGN